MSNEITRNTRFKSKVSTREKFRQIKLRTFNGSVVILNENTNSIRELKKENKILESHIIEIVELMEKVNKKMINHLGEQE